MLSNDYLMGYRRGWHDGLLEAREILLKALENGGFYADGPQDQSAEVAERFLDGWLAARPPRARKKKNRDA